MARSAFSRWRVLAFYRDSPRQHFLTNEAEAQLVDGYERAAHEISVQPAARQ